MNRVKMEDFLNLILVQIIPIGNFEVRNELSQVTEMVKLNRSL